MTVREFISELESEDLTAELVFENENGDVIDYVGLSDSRFLIGADRVIIGFNCEGAYEREEK